MTKKYENPMLQIVSIKNNDIVVTSGPGINTSSVVEVGNIGAPDRIRDDWDAGY